MWNQKPSFRFEIDKFSEKKAVISSMTFVSGGCEWYLTIYPTGDSQADCHLSLYLQVSNPTTLPTGWKRSIDYYFVLLNQSEKELFRSPIASSTQLFCAATPALGYRQTLPLSKFQEEGFLEKDKLIIDVYIKSNGEGGDVSTKKKKTLVDFNGFHVFDSQVTKVGRIFTEHPDIAKDFKPTNHEVKTAYMNVLLRVIKTLNKPPKSLSETRLSKASSELSELMSVGFKLDWLKLKLEEVSLERQKADADESQIQQLDERVKNLELMEAGLKIESLNTKLDEVSLERKKSDDTNESRIKEVEQRFKYLALKEASFNKRLNTMLDDLSLEKKKSDDTNEYRAKQVEQGFNKRLDTMLDELERRRSYDTSVFDSRFEQIEEHVMGLGLKLDNLNTKLEVMSKEKKKADDADGSLAQELEDSVKNVELMVSHLKVEVDKKKDKSCADDGFLLVD